MYGADTGRERHSLMMNDDSGYENLNKISWIPQKFMECLLGSGQSCNSDYKFYFYFLNMSEFNFSFSIP